MVNKKQTVVIVGGGFAGLHLAMGLSGSSYHVLLIDKENHHMFQPLFYQVASARLEPSNISFPFRKIFQKSRNVEIRMAEVLAVNLDRKTLETTEGLIPYHILVLANGCKTNYFGNAQLAKHAFSMKTSQEAIDIRNEILLSFERFVWASPEERKDLLNLVIVGAGPTGVELAGAFAEMRKNVLPKDYPQVDLSSLKVIVIEGSKHTLNSMSDDSKKASEKYLRDLNVELRTETIVESYDGKVLRLKNGEEIRTQKVIWAAGVTGNVMKGMPLNTIMKNRYIVNRYNEVAGCEDVFALGDIAYMSTPKYPNAHPQLANVAINQAKNLASNLKRRANGKKLVEYEYRDLGSMATVGKRRAVVDLPFLKFHGRLAWFTWMFLHLMLILSVKNKLKIFINWAWHYFTNDSSLRLIFKTRSTNP
jgi:NADH dehydrogenase